MSATGDRVRVEYGDMVCVASKDVGGYVGTDRGVKDSLFVNSMRDPDGPVHALQSCVFTIVQKYQYNAAKAFEKRLKTLKVLTITKENWKEKLDYTDPLFKELMHHTMSIQEEKDTNEMESIRKSGEPLLYGSEIQIASQNMRSFMTQTKNRAEVDGLSMELEMVEGGGEASWWRVRPAEKIHSEGDVVMYGEQVILENVKFENSYVNISVGTPVGQLIEDKETGKLTPTQPYMYMHPSTTAQYEVNASDNASRLALVPFHRYKHRCRTKVNDTLKDAGGGQEEGTEENSHFLSGMDVVTVEHRQRDSYLMSRLESDEVFWESSQSLRSYVEHNHDVDKARATAEKAADAVKERLDSVPRLMWRIKPIKVQYAGEPLKRQSDVILLQHMQSGKYLTIKDNKALLRADMEDWDAHWTIACFGPHEHKNGHIMHDEAVWLRQASARKGVSSWLSHPYTRCNEVLSRQHDQAPAQTNSGNQMDSLDVLELRIIPQKHTESIDFLRTCRNILDGLISGFKASEPLPAGLSNEEALQEAYKHPLKHIVMNVMKVYTNFMTTLILTCTFSSEMDPLTRSGPPNTEKQDLLRQMGMLERCMQLIITLDKHLHFPFKNSQTRLKPIFIIVRYAYKLVQMVCEENTLSKQMLFQHEPLLREHLVAEVGSFWVMLAVFQDSRELIDKQADEEIQLLGGILHATRAHRILKFLSVTCVCQSHPIPQNQSRIARVVLEQNSDVLFTVLFRDDDIVLRCELGKSPEVSVKSLRQFTPQELSDDTSDQPQLRAHLFHLATIELIIKLLVGRNEYVQRVCETLTKKLCIGYDDVVKILQHEDVPYSWKALYCELLNRLYIDKEPHVGVQVVFFTRIWATINTQQAQGNTLSHPLVRSDDDDCREAEEIRQAIAGLAKFEDLKKVLVSLAEDHVQTDCDNMERNKFVTALISVFQMLLQFAFYHRHDPISRHPKAHFESIRETCRPLLRILDGRTDLCTPFGGFSRDDCRFRSSPKTNLVMEQKSRALACLGSFFQTSQNERISRFVGFWEGIIDKNFNLTSWDAAQESCFNMSSSHHLPPPRPDSEMGETDEGKSPFKIDSGKTSPLRTPSLNGGMSPLKEAPPLGGRFALMSGSKDSFKDTNRSPSRSIDGIFRNMRRSGLGLRSSRVAADDTKTLGMYASDPTKWKQSPPWTKQDVKDLKEALFGGPALILEEFNVSGLALMSERGHHDEIPDWIKILLDLVRYRLPALKEKAILFLIASFNQHPNFIATVLKAQVIYDPAIAKIYYDARVSIARLRKQIQLLGVHDMEQKAKAFEFISNRITEWQNLLIVTTRRPRSVVFGIQQLLANLGVYDIMVQILFIPLQRVPATNKGELDGVTDLNLRDLFNTVYKLLASICDENPELQLKTLPLTYYKDFHIGIEGIDIEGSFSTICNMNMQISRQVGPEWVPLCFSLMRKYQARRVGWVKLLRSLVKCGKQPIRENQLLVITHLKVNERIAAMIMKTPEEWDERIMYMQTDELEAQGSKSQLAFHLAIMDLLAVVCEGKNPAAEVLAASYLSLEDCIRGLVKLNIKSDGTAVELPYGIECKVKGKLMGVLTQVYVETNIVRLQGEMSREDNGVWSFDPKDASWGNCTPLMHTISQELGRFAQIMANNTAVSTCQSSDLHAAKSYYFGMVMPFLRLYYSKTYGLVKGSTPDDVRISIEIFDTVKQIDDLLVDYGTGWTVMIEGELSYPRETTLEVLQALSSKAKIRPEYAHQKRMQGGDAAIVNQSTDFMTKASNTLSVGFRALIEDLATAFGISDTRRLIGQGILQLAMMLHREGSVPLYDPTHFIALNRPTPPNPTYNDFVVSILDISRARDTDKTVLRDILRVLRAILYVYEPHDSDKAPSECVDEWQAFLQYDIVPKKRHGPPAEVLQWAQHKYDAMGATVAAIRLTSHPDVSVQIASICLLITLLQGGNKRVQEAICAYLAESKDTSFFASLRTTLDKAAAALKDFKRIIKTLKAMQQAGQQRSRSVSMMDISANFNGGPGQGDVKLPSMMEGSAWNMLGKQSQVMFTLRLLQLMCQGQHEKMQGLLQKQPGSVSHDIFRRLIDLFEMAQPLIQDALSLNDDTDLVGLGIQLADTINAAIMGPHHGNRSALVSSNFLAVANRVFSGVVYAEMAERGNEAERGNGAFSVNDLKCWFKMSVLRCCLSLFEGISDPRMPAQMLEFFELRNITTQLVSIGRLVGLVEPWEVLSDEGKNKTDDQDSVTKMLSISGSVNSKSGRMASMKMNSMNAERVIGNKGQYHKRSSSLVWSEHVRRTYVFGPGWQESLSEEMFNFYLLLANFISWDNTFIVRKKVQQLKTEIVGLSKFLEKHVMSVELVRNFNSPEQSVEELWFRVSPEICNLVMSRDFRSRTEGILFSVPRDNPQEKARAFLARLSECLRRLSWHLYLGKNRYKKFLVRYRGTIDPVPLYLSMLITMLLMAIYGIPMDPNTNDIVAKGMFFSDPSVYHPGYVDEEYPFANQTSDPLGSGKTYGSVTRNTDLSLKYRLSMMSRWQSEAEWAFWPGGRELIMALAIVHVIFSVFNGFIMSVQDQPLLMRQAVTEHFSNATQDSKGDEKDDKSASKRMEGIRYLDDMPPPPSDPELVVSLNLMVDLIRFSAPSMYFALLTIISILGCVNTPFFYVLHMLDYFRRPDGRLVLQAIIVGGPNLIRSFIIGVIVVVIFGFTTYSFFSQTVIMSSDLCHSPYQCVIKHILDSLTGDLSTVLGDAGGNQWAFSGIVFWKDMWEGWRTFFVFVSLIFWVFLLQGIIQGQIIDAFAAMRSMSNEEHEDLEQRCFVSSIERFIFNGYPGEWDKRQGGQYAWNYLLFVTMLLNKNKEDYNGIENAVASSFAKNKIDFLPVGVFAAQYKESMLRLSPEDQAVKNERLLKSLEQEMLAFREGVNDELGKMRIQMDKVMAALAMRRMQRPSVTPSNDSGEAASPRSAVRRVDPPIRSVTSVPSATSSDVVIPAASPTSAADDALEEDLI